MNLSDARYTQFNLVREMLETPEIIRKFDINGVKAITQEIGNFKKILFTGEGSSRIFPSKRAISQSLEKGYDLSLYTEAAAQAQSYQLESHAVLAASNSGKTKEVISLLAELKEKGHKKLFGVTAFKNSPVHHLTNWAYILSCGAENACAATKSVMEQALVYDVIIRSLAGDAMPDLNRLADAIEQVLQMNIDNKILDLASPSPLLYFSGRNDGVGEELRLKTNEITRKKSDFLEGTYAVHGIEEVMERGETVIVIDPFEQEEEKFNKALVEGVGINVIAISHRETSFPTIIIPEIDGIDQYIQLAAGWNLLVEIGLVNGIDLDKPSRARKIGNEFLGNIS